MNQKRYTIWTTDIPSTKKFYTRYFAGKAGKIIKNKNFESTIIKFGNGPIIELRNKIDGSQIDFDTNPIEGDAQITFQFENTSQVDNLTDWITDEGYPLGTPPEVQASGHYESIVFDPNNNRVGIIHVSKSPEFEMEQ